MSRDQGSRQLPPPVQQLLAQCIDSFEKLEVLLVMCRHPDQFFSAEQLAGRLNLPASVTTATLAALHSAGILDVSSASNRLFHYKPRDQALARSVDELASAYQRDATLVVKSIANRAIERVRSSAARMFADAFRLGHDTSKGKKNG